MNSKFNFIILLVTISTIPLNYNAAYFLNNKRNFNLCPEPLFPKECTCLSLENLICENFLNYYILNFSSNDDTSRFFQSVKLKPANNLNLDESLNLKGIQLENNALISLSGINSFSYLANPFDDVSILKSELNLELADSVIEFFYEKSLLSSICNLVSIDETKRPFFSLFKNIDFLGSVIYPSVICPLIFKDTFLTILKVSNLSASNNINFISLSNTSKVNFNSTIKRLEIQTSSFNELTSQILNKDVFLNLEELSITDSNLTQIDDQLFGNFRELKFLLLYLNNFSEFIRNKNNNTWMSSLNKTNNELLIGMIDSKKIYDFPEKDFCYFIYFPHDSNVYAYIQTKSNLNCSSCTLIWLLKNWNQSSNAALIQSSDSVYECFAENNLVKFNERTEECNFDEKIKECLNIIDPIEQLPEQGNLELIIVLVVSGLVLISIVIVLFVCYYCKFYKKCCSSSSKFPHEFSKSIFNEYGYDVFQRDNYDYGLAKSIEHVIEYNGKTPRASIISATRPQTSDSASVPRTSGGYLFKANSIEPVILDIDGIQNQIDEMLRRKIISQIGIINNEDFLQKTHISNNKLLIDFTHLNQATRLFEGKNNTTIHEVRDRLLEANFYSLLDFNAGSFQIKLEEHSKRKTIFEVANRGFFQFEVIPPGLVNSLNTFNMLMESLNLDFKWCTVYNGKIIIFSKSLEENFENLKKMLLILRKNNLKIKKENCLLFQNEIELYKNVFKEKKLIRNAQTVSVISKILLPSNVQGLSRFLNVVEIYKSELNNEEVNLEETNRRWKNVI